MTILILVFEFFKTGLFAIGGGLATVPFLFDIAARHAGTAGFYTASQLGDAIAVSQAFPGATGVNMAAYTGFLTAGVAGAVCAVLALVAPSIVVIMIVSAFLRKFAEDTRVKRVFYGLTTAAAGMLTIAVWSMLKISLAFDTAAVGIIFAVTFVPLFVLRRRKIRISPLFVILWGGLVGFAFSLL